MFGSNAFYGNQTFTCLSADGALVVVAVVVVVVIQNLPVCLEIMV